MDDLKERYLQDQLTEEERIAFEESLSKEEKEELVDELGIRDEIQAQFRQELRKKVSEFERPTSRFRMLFPTTLGVAATVLLISSIVFYLVRDQQHLFEQYYTSYPNYELTAVRGDEELTNREKAYKAYDLKNYEQAIVEFNSLDSLLVADRFFRGISYLESQKQDLALNDLENVIKINDENYAPAAIWYSSLIYVDLDQIDKAIPLLRELSISKSEFSDEAEKLLGEL